MKRSVTMKKLFNKALMVILAAIMILSSAPMGSIAKTISGSPVAIVAQAASKKTHLNTTKKSIYIGKKYTLKLIDKKGKTIPASKVKWSRSNKTVASVSKSGTVTGKKAGKIKITATYKGKKYTAVITVKSAVSLSKSKVTFKAGETAKKTIKVTCKDDKGIKWKTVEGSGIVKLSQAKKWKNDTKSLYITPTGKKFGKVKIKVYSKENSKSYDYLTIEVNKPYTLKVKNKLPCEIRNCETQADYNDVFKYGIVKINKITYKTPDTKALNITIDFEAKFAMNFERHYYIKYKILDKDGDLVKSDITKTEFLRIGVKSKSEISFKNLKNGAYTIEFVDYIAEETIDMPSDYDNIITDITSKKALSMYQKAVKDISEKGVAGYSKKSWQTLDSINITGSSVLQSSFKSLLEGFLTTEEDTEVKVFEKGSEESMKYMPLSNCSEEAVKSVTVKESGSNMLITIVMKDQLNPTKTDTDGLNVMSNDILYMEDVYDVIENDSAVSSVIKKVNRADVTYKGYTIKATMTKDGKLVSIEHYGPADIVAEMNTITGNIGFSGRINFNAKYYDFRY